MPSADELYEAWKRRPPTEVRLDDFRKVLFARIPNEAIIEGTGGSHLLVVHHKALSFSSAFGGHGNFSVPVKGHSVQQHYARLLIQAIDLIEEYEQWKRGQR